MRVVLIGPGDIEYHYEELLEIEKIDLDDKIDEIASVLAKSDVELIILPDREISFEIAKKYKEKGGKKVIGTIPKKDKDFGIKHLKKYIEEKVNDKPIIDEIFDTENWYKQDMAVTMFGDVVLMLGNSLGTLGEFAYGLYLYKIFKGKKKGVDVLEHKIHPEIKAGSKHPFTIIIFKPFIKDKLNTEIETYCRKIGAKLVYIESAKELHEIVMHSFQKE
jgi:hypothetical protein